MSDSKTNKPVVAWVSSWHRKDNQVNVVGVKEKVIYTEPDGSTRYEDRVTLYNDPVRPYWLTKPHLRTYEYKKEFEDIANLDQHLVHDSELTSSLASELGYNTYRKWPLRQLCGSPYVYGADIETEVLVKQKYLHNTPADIVIPYTRGFFDIEAEVTGEKRINLITFMHERTVYTTMLKEYMVHRTVDSSGKETCTPFGLDEVKTRVEELLGEFVKANEFELNFAAFDTEKEMFVWIFQQIHKHKTDFIGIWNLGYDIPRILERCEALNIDPASFMCHPDIPKHIQFVHWKQDKSVVDHFTDKWHWLTIAGYTQFIDSMCLYARLRKVTGRESSYALDDISNKILGTGKLHFSAVINHQYMQKFRFLDYIAYNINDVLIMGLMEFKTNDMKSLCTLSGMSLLSQFSKQTVLVRNDAYNYGKQHGKIPCSTGLSMFTEFDKTMSKAGGAVLPPNKAVGVSVPVISEFSRETQASVLCNDLDVSSMYPSIMSAFNISKETALSTVLQLVGRTTKDTELYFSAVNRPDINALDICTKFYGLPHYNDMLAEFENEMCTAHLTDGTSIRV